MTHAIHETAGSEPLVTVSTWRCRPGHEQELAAFADELMDTAARFEGHLSGTVLHTEGEADYHIVHRFRGRAELARWLDSPERAAFHDRLGEIADAQGPSQRVTGLETWFLDGGAGIETLKPPPRWKMWLASFLGAYPLVVLFQWLLAPSLDDLPLLLRAAIFPLILLSLMTYLAMPLITRLLRRWLYPDRSR